MPLASRDTLATDLHRHHRAVHALAVMDHADLAGATRRTVEALADALGVARVSVWVYDAERTAIICRALTDQGTFSDEPVTLGGASYPRYFEALRTQRLIDASDARHDPRTSEFAVGYLDVLGITSMLDVAVVVGDESIGVLCAEHVGPVRQWTTAEADLMTSAAALLAIGFTLKRQRSLEEQLRHSQKMEAVGLLAGGIAHDVNNVLNVVLGEAELLEDDASDPVAVREGLVSIRDAARKAAGLTHKLLTFSRQRVVTLVMTDLSAVVRDFERMARGVAGERVNVIVRRPAAPLRILADGTLLEQVLLNLVVNACQAMPEGGALEITVGAAPDGTTIRDVTAAHAGPFATITVRDTGVGIPADVLRRIWEPFFSTRELGSGLGLAITHGAVREMHGAASVESVVGQGTTFSLHFPLLETPVAEATGPAADAVTALHAGASILLAEDDPAIRVVLAALLRRAGHSVTETTDGGMALAQFERQPTAFDLLVSDVVMPVLDGPTAFARMRAIRPDFGALFLSGYDPNADLLAGLEREGARVRQLGKPVDRETLLRNVGYLLNGSAPV